MPQSDLTQKNRSKTMTNAREALLYEHEDGLHAVHFGAGSPAFAHNEPKWRRVGPVSMPDDESCPHGDSHIVHDCLRCGAPVCCGKCCVRDAYEGAREDLLDWKKRALKAEELVRKFAREVNGPVHLGEPAQPSPQPSDAPQQEDEQFRNGAKAMFDALLMRAANNWHARPEANAVCDAENKLIEDWAAEALEDVSPEDHAAWKSIGKSYAEGYERGRREAAIQQPQPAEQGEDTALREAIDDAARWQMLPAFLEKYQINYVALLRDIDAARAAQGQKGQTP